MSRRRNWRPRTLTASLFAILLLVLAACGSSGSQSNSSTPLPTAQQILRIPNVGASDLTRLDPASGPDSNSNMVIGMVFSGLVKTDQNLNVEPDQATWTVSDDNKVYTFHLKSGLTFSDGTPVTAQTYVDSWTRALLPSVKSPTAPVLMQNIVGASAVNAGKSTTLTGVKALNPQTLQVTLTQPTAYFLQLLTVSLFYPINLNVVNKYGQTAWVQHAAGSGIGTGPFIIKSWTPGSMVFVPNTHYYGAHTKLKEVDMTFVNDPSTALNSYRAGQYDLTWDIASTDQPTVQNTPGFERKPILETDSLFFDNKTAPFNNTAVRQAFAYAIDKSELAKALFNNTVTPANTIVPPGEPGAQPNFAGLTFNQTKARALLQSVYPDVSKMPTVTFSYPSSQVTPEEAAALQQMWKSALGVQVRLNGMELAAYNNATETHTVQFGFTQWGVYFPDPYEWLDQSLLSNSPNNNGFWSNAQFDQDVTQAEQTSGNARIALYQKAEQIAIDQVGWLPLFHESMAAIISSKVHGVQLSGRGLYFGDWSGVYLT